MSLLNVINIAGTGMTAQMTRLNVIASNLSNQDSITSDDDKTYRARMPVFQAMLDDANAQNAGVGGVKVAAIVENEEPLRRELMPGHPLADEDGYVNLPNVNAIQEMADMISASRSFQDNVQLVQTVKNLMISTIQSMDDKV